jgi:endonuclease/exonuclease/phosphatase family metal-dependent hydrolase
MKIATYNLSFLYGEGVHKYSGKDYMFDADFVEKRIDYFSKEFTKINADILFLQELGSEEVLKRIIEKMNQKYEYFIAEPDVNGVGNAVLYKIDNCVCESVSAKADLPVFITGDQDVLGSRMYSRRDFIHLKTMYYGKPIHFLGIHIKSNFLVPEKNIDGSEKPMDTQSLVADGRIRSEIFRFSQARKVRELTDRFFTDDSSVSVVVLGDFNSQPRSPVIKIIQGEIKNNPDYLITITDRIPEEKRFSMVGSEYHSLIDHILISRNLEQSISGLEILNENLLNRTKNNESPFIVESDHAPIILHLK